MKRKIRSTFEELFPNTKNPILFAHRGCNKAYPENSLSAFKEALDQKTAGIELDIHLTKDEVPVIMHDYNTLRVTGTNKIIAETNLLDLEKLNIAANSPLTEKMKIPTLEELFKLGGDALYYDIEVKEKKKLQLILDKVEALSKKYNLDSKIIISSFNPLTVRKAVKMGFKRTAVIYSDEKEVPRFLRNGFGRKISGCSIVKPSRQQALKALAFSPKVLVMSWTIDTQKEADKLNAAGVCGICSNRPEDLQ